MDALTKQQLDALNEEFYKEFARSFADTRSAPQPGFYELERFLPLEDGELLDVGCGEGRFGRFLLERRSVAAYDGIDGSEELLDIARGQLSGRFWQRNLIDPDAFRGIGQYDCIACLAVLQHIPGRDTRALLMTEMGRHLTPEGRLLISTWQFLTSERQRRKIVDWREVGLKPEMLEPNDYLLTWHRDGRGLRYVNYINEAELLALSHEAGLRTVATFRSDGREGNLNLYSVHELERSD